MHCCCVRQCCWLWKLNNMRWTKEYNSNIYLKDWRREKYVDFQLLSKSEMNSQTKFWNTHNWVNYYELCDEIPELLLVNKVFSTKKNWNMFPWYRNDIQFKKLSKYLRERGLVELWGKWEKANKHNSKRSDLYNWFIFLFFCWKWTSREGINRWEINILTC